MVPVANDPRLPGSPAARYAPRTVWIARRLLNVFIRHLAPHRLTTLTQVTRLAETCGSRYEEEHPNQARSCGHRPQQVACPTIPPPLLFQRSSTRIADWCRSITAPVRPRSELTALIRSGARKTIPVHSVQRPGRRNPRHCGRIVRV